MTADHRSVLWRGVDPFSAELCRLTRADRAWDFAGLVVADLPDGGTEIRYLLRVDELWRARRLRVEMFGAHTGSLDLVGDGRGSWNLDGERAQGLDGCVDVDLAITPATNTLPIRRLDPPLDRPVTARVAWVRIPDLAVEADEQRYERHGDRMWTFRSEDFEAQLEVDDDGLVVRYGTLWERVVASGD